MKAINGSADAWAFLMESGCYAHIVDKAGKPYIGHLRRVYSRVLSSSLPALAVAVLHDVIEDYGWGVLAGYSLPVHIADALEAITRGQDEPWNKYIRRVKQNEIARVVKLADLEDNMDLTRIPRLDKEWLARLGRYHRAYRFLRGESPKP